MRIRGISRGRLPRHQENEPHPLPTIRQRLLDYDISGLSIDTRGKPLFMNMNRQGVLNPKVLRVRILSKLSYTKSSRALSQSIPFPAVCSAFFPTNPQSNMSEIKKPQLTLRLRLIGGQPLRFSAYPQQTQQARQPAAPLGSGRLQNTSKLGTKPHQIRYDPAWREG